MVRLPEHSRRPYRNPQLALSCSSRDMSCLVLITRRRQGMRVIRDLRDVKVRRFRGVSLSLLLQNRGSQTNPFTSLWFCYHFVFLVSKMLCLKQKTIRKRQPSLRTLTGSLLQITKQLISFSLSGSIRNKDIFRCLKNGDVLRKKKERSKWKFISGLMKSLMKHSLVTC